MEIVISEDFALTPAIKEAIREKVDQVSEHLKDDPAVKIFLSKDGGKKFKILMNVHSRHQDFSSHAEDEDFYVALNSSKAKLIRQINDFKEKVITRRHA